MPNEYKVTFVIEVDAENPYDAVFVARRLLVDAPELEATVTLTDSIKKVTIDTTAELKEQVEHCLYCGAEVSANETVPAIDEDRVWERYAKVHNQNCDWVRTRAFRI